MYFEKKFFSEKLVLFSKDYHAQLGYLRICRDWDFALQIKWLVSIWGQHWYLIGSANWMK